MQPEDIVSQLKRKGVFDDFRKQLLCDFQTHDIGHQFINVIQGHVESIVENDPSLLEKDRATFHMLLMDSIEKSGYYKTLEKDLTAKVKQDTNFQASVQEKIDQVIQNQ
ncbi:hypothetical protein DM01DRAFT_1407382 [Hesseltinella vesiculosa]|uniref:BOD1/SHG1 domain-containing protein n=1 Tax=Hesseltinella vesiculosa TaxID=101127 RepID=A0A1X2GIM2_9FUNG|nr:hypothetical protein DM01DRAFT_1407382 [Hesseltinella vesiculosa]